MSDASGADSENTPGDRARSILGDKFERIVLVVSTGRTATRAIAHYFDHHYENVYARHEPAPSRLLRLASNLYLGGRISRDRLRSILVRCRRRRLSGIGEPIYLETNPFLHGCLDVLDEVFGEVRVCHVIRHPGQQVTSYMNFGVFRGLKGIAGRWAPFWLHKPEHDRQNRSEKWSAMTETERLAWRWNSINAYLNRGEQLFPGRYLRVKYEELFTGSRPEIERLAEWIGLDPDRRWTERAAGTRVHASQETQCPAWVDWDPEPRRRLLERCGALMRLYGYEA